MIRRPGTRWTALLLTVVMLAAVILGSSPVLARSKKNKKKKQQNQTTQTSQSSDESSVGTLIGSLIAGLISDDDGSAALSADGETGGAKSGSSASAGNGSAGSEDVSVTEDGTYTSRDEVALYIHLFGHLPSNYITKREAQDLGWSGGTLEPYAPGKSIGGGRFGNYEGTLPYEKGRQYYECDIDYDGGKRNAKRIVYSSDGLIFYTEDHYSTFEQLY